MKTVTLTRGLSGSGKSTWAKEQVDKSQGKTIIVCKDDIRNMLHNGAYSSGREAMVKKVRNSTILLALEQGYNVIVADTNFDNHEEDIRKIVFGNYSTAEVEFKIQDFTHVPLKTCIERDAQRTNPLGEKVIRDQYNRWIKKDLVKLVQDESLPKACLFDLDGTLFEKSPNRGYFEWNKVNLDTPKDYVLNLLKLYHNSGFKIILLSGRKEEARKGTIECLSKYNIPFDSLFMRADNDDRSDDITKKELFDNNVRCKYYVEAVIDDRPRVLRLWFEIGLNVFSVNHPDNEF